MNRILLISLIVVVGFALAACSSTPVKKENAESTIQPTGNYEDCADAKPGQVIKYSFNSSAPVDFNIHYHAEKIYYPVDKKGISSDSGTYEPEKEDIFCLMWTNPQSQAASLKYNFSIENRAGATKTGY
jgi:hypothetical protein